jgi:hypothetical protein
MDRERESREEEERGKRHSERGASETRRYFILFFCFLLSWILLLVPSSFYLKSSCRDGPLFCFRKGQPRTFRVLSIHLSKNVSFLFVGKPNKIETNPSTCQKMRGENCPVLLSPLMSECANFIVCPGKKLFRFCLVFPRTTPSPQLFGKWVDLKQKIISLAVSSHLSNNMGGFCSSPLFASVRVVFLNGTGVWLRAGCF